MLKSCLSLLFALLAGLMTVMPGANASAQVEPVLADEMRLALQQEQAPGAIWSIVDETGQWIGAEGYSNAQSRSRLTPGHKVHVGSVAKTVIALGVLQLVTEGRLKLDAPVEAILPEIRFQSRSGSTRPVLVRHLLDHTAGLEDARIWQVFSRANTPDMPLRDVFTRDPAVLRLRTPPGETYSYSNMGYTLVAMIIERVTGERYETRIERSLLRPLGMNDSTLLFTTQQGARRDPGLAWGHLGNGSLAAAVPMAVRPAGQFTTTAADMVRLARFLMSNGTIGNRTLVDPGLLRKMGHPQGTAAQVAGLEAGYGLGLVARDREGRLGYCHQGDTVGFHALLCIYPDEQKAFFLALNRDGDGLDVKRFHKLLIGATGARGLPAQPSAPLRPDIADWLGTYQPVTTRFALERYMDLLDGGSRLELQAGRLIFTRSGRDPIVLTPTGNGLFRGTDRVRPSHVLFERGGDRLIADGERSFRKVSPGAPLLLWASLSLGLAGLTWFLAVVPLLIAFRRRQVWQPVSAVLLSFAPISYLVYRLPYIQWGDIGWATGLLATATLILPVALIWQIWAVARARPWLWRADLIAAIAALQWIAVLAWFGLIPLRLWV